MSGTRVAAGVAVLLTLGGCAASTGSTDSTGDASTTPEATASREAPPTSPVPATPVATGTAAEDDETDVPFLDAGATAEAEPSDGARLTVTAVRVGQHRDYDRTVFDVAGTGTPGWYVSAVDRAHEDATDRLIELAGDGTLQVILTGMGYPMDTGYDEWSGAPIATEGYGQLWEVHFVGTFEGQTQAFIGTKDDEVPFRVFTLADPLRVVVDVRH